MGRGRIKYMYIAQNEEVERWFKGEYKDISVMHREQRNIAIE